MNRPFSQRQQITLLLALFVLLCNACSQSTTAPTKRINRQAVVERHSPSTTHLNPQSPFTLGNGQFAFTADITGLQSLPERYFDQGIPLETKANWAWHTRATPHHYVLDDANEIYDAYHRSVAFPTNMQTAAGQWLRQNPHDLPLARFGLLLDGKPIEPDNLQKIDQTLNIWQGQLTSRYRLSGEEVSVNTLVDSESDTLAVRIQSSLLSQQRLQVAVKFPRGYDLSVKNTPNILWNEGDKHQSTVINRQAQSVLIQRQVDTAVHFVRLGWEGKVAFDKNNEHSFRLTSTQPTLTFSAHFSQTNTDSGSPPAFNQLQSRTAQAWIQFWQHGAAIDFAGSTHPQANELERRIILSRYLLAAQSRAVIPSQETGLTSSSWYGKHHSEMTWWHSAHWALWGNPQELQKVLDWYKNQLSSAQSLAKKRGLKGARWAKMVGPDNRESPGGNPLIIWNQPQVIHLAELLYRHTEDSSLLEGYQTLVEDTADAMASMLTWDATTQTYNLEPPIWIAQEIYPPRLTRNPTFELAYWREGLTLAQRWRQRLQQPPREDWQQKIDALAPLPIKNGKYVAIESIPDTFDQKASRKDHPSMLAAYGLLVDPTVDKKIMLNTLQAVLNSWDWQEKIWGWDYPMIAMTATRLQKPAIATDILLADLTHNQYLPNGHCPQAGANLPVYLPANGALLAAVAMMVAGWHNNPEELPGFPRDAGWTIKTEGFKPIF